MSEEKTLNKVRVAKNGITSYKESTTRGAGTVYVDKKMFVNGEGPDSITITAANLAEVPVKAPTAAATGETTEDNVVQQATTE